MIRDDQYKRPATRGDLAALAGRMRNGAIARTVMAKHNGVSIPAGVWFMRRDGGLVDMAVVLAQLESIREYNRRLAEKLTANGCQGPSHG